MTLSAFSASCAQLRVLPPETFPAGLGQRVGPGLLAPHPFLGLIKCSLYCRDVLRCNLFLSSGFRAKLKVVGLWVLFWFQTPPSERTATRGLCQGVLGPLVGTGEHPNFLFCC